MAADPLAPGPSSARSGLRERKKLATRRALHDAALRLALERGLEHVTVEEISAAADVSVRTFFNYFPNKEQAIIGDPFLVDEERVTEVIRAADTVLDGLREVSLAVTADVGPRRAQVLMRWELMDRYPALLGQMLAALAEFEKIVARAVSARTGDQADDAYPQLMAAIAAVTMRVSVQRWTAGHGGRPLEIHVNEVFGLLAGELAPGAPRAGSGEGRVERDSNA
ncbi:MAG: TetR family transcriptional regulator [Trebonia sp.]